ncbi:MULTISPECIES: sensor histidine kinase [Solirubrobacterales]|nr:MULTISPECIES: GAF domain-containing sensor histidine kinase [Solirubrobacterales]
MTGSAGQELDDPRRLAALERRGLFASAPDTSFDRFTRIVATVLDVPLAQLSLVGEHEERYLSRRTDDPDLAAMLSGPVADSACQWVVRSGAEIVAEDAESHELLADSPAIGKGLRAYCGFPLRRSGGEIIGTLCAIDFAPRPWTEEHVKLVSDLSDMVVTEIELRDALELATERTQELEDAARGLRTLQDVLDESEHERDRTERVSIDLASTIAHELRTPLFAIRGLAEVMLAEAPASGLATDVAMIDRTAQEALELVNEQLQLARTEAGHAVVDASDVALEEVLGALRGMMAPVPRAPGVELVVEPAPADVPALRTDPGKLAQILRNLVANALRHTERGEVRVAARLVDDGTRVAFTVRDTGAGIPADDLERIFQPFERAGDSEDGRGTGLGLPLARKLADLLGGTVDVESEPGVGSTFTATVAARYGAT